MDENIIHEFCGEGHEQQARDWYFARWFVRYRLPEFWNISIGIRSPKHLHVVLLGVTSHMVAIARQIALYAHYPNFDDRTGRNRTILTFVVAGGGTAEAVKKLEKELGTLYTYCQEATEYTFFDIGFQIREKKYEPTRNDEIQIIVTEEALAAAEASYKQERISTDEFTWGKMVNLVYSFGGEMDDLVITDPTNQAAFIHALRHFSSNVNDKKLQENAWKGCSPVNKLSSLFSADNRHYRLLPILDDEDIAELKFPNCQTQEQKLLYAFRHYPSIMRAYLEDESHLLIFSQMEHARWNVTQLALGFRPMSIDEQLYAHRFRTREQKFAYYKKCKTRKVDPTHIAICSNRDLGRLKPDDRKFDAFIILCILEILLTKNKRSLFSFFRNIFNKSHS